MLARATLALASLTLVAALTACAAPAPEPSAETPAEQPGGDAAGSRLAPGLYEQEDGTVQVLGTLEYSDLEGGLWTITGGTAAEGNEGETLAVIANAADFEAQLNELKDSQVFASGTMVEGGASIRMAGPEIELTKIEAVSDTGGPAE